jgi:hypothetical protein
MSFAFHIEVAIGAGKPDDAATAGAEPNQAVTAQRVNVDPKCEFALYRRPPAAPSAAVSAHGSSMSIRNANSLSTVAPPPPRPLP